MAGFPEAPSLDASGKLISEETSAPETTSADQNLSPASEESSAAQQAYELEKLGKFKFQGQEWTAKDLERAILRQKDYTQKTQAVAKEREQLESTFKAEEKYYKNLSFDIGNVLRDPSLAAKFIEVYPEKFHSYLKEALAEASKSQSTQPQQQQANQQRGYPNVDEMSRLRTIEKRFHEQDVKAHEAEINSTVETLQKKYPHAIPELAIGRAFEAHNAGVKLTPDVWDGIFKSVDEQIQGVVRSQYGELVKKQKEANAKGRSGDAGGGTPGKAPAVAKNFKEAQAMMLRDLQRR